MASRAAGLLVLVTSVLAAPACGARREAPAPAHVPTAPGSARDRLEPPDARTLPGRVDGGAAAEEDHALPALPASEETVTARPPAVASGGEPGDCTAPLAWDGRTCVSTDCSAGARFVVGRGCIYPDGMPACVLGCGRPPRVDGPAYGEEDGFDRRAASVALGAVNLRTCALDRGAGEGYVRVTFAPTGEVAKVAVDDHFARSPAAACVAARFRRARVPPFRGAPVTVRKSFRVP